MIYYSLPSISTAIGTLNFHLWSEYDTLVAPTGAFVISLSQLTKKAQVSLDAQEFEQITIAIADDYTNHTYGFWYKVTQGDWRLTITFTETAIIDGTPTEQTVFLFAGVPLREEISWEDRYLDTATNTLFLRTAELNLVSILSTMNDLTMDELIAEILLNGIETVGGVNTMSLTIKLKDIFSCLLSKAPTGGTALNASYDSDDTTFIHNSTDLLFYDAADNEFAFDRLYLNIGFGGTPGMGHTATYQFDVTHADCYSKYYTTVSQFISDILKTFGLILWTGCDVSDADPENWRYKIELRQMWRAYATEIDFDHTEKDSVGRLRDDLQIEGSRATHYNNQSAFVWYSRKYHGTTEQTGTVPNYILFDLEFSVPFKVDPSHPNDYEGSPLYASAADISTGDANPEVIDDVKFYNYVDAVVEDTIADDANHKKLVHLAAGYQFCRLTKTVGNIERIYGTLQTTDVNESSVYETSIRMTDILRRQSVNDGIAVNVYYINEVSLDFDKLETKVEFIQE